MSATVMDLVVVFTLFVFMLAQLCFCVAAVFPANKDLYMQGTSLTREEEEQNENSCFGLNDDSRPTIQLAGFSPANVLRRPITTRPPL